MIAIPLAINSGSVAMILGRWPTASCNQYGHDPPFIAIRGADDCGSLHLPVATRNHVRPDAQSRALSGADSLRPKPAPDARCMTLSARSLRRTQDRARRRTLAETGGQSPSACKGGRDQRQGARLATRPARPPACRKTLERWSWAMAVMRRAWLSEKIERVAQAEDDFLDGFPCSFRGVSG